LGFTLAGSKVYWNELPRDGPRSMRHLLHHHPDNIVINWKTDVKDVKRSKRLKVKDPGIYIPPLTGKPEQQRFTVRSGVLTSIISRRRSAISGRHCPHERSFWTHHLCPIQTHYGLHPRATECVAEGLFRLYTEWYFGDFRAQESRHV